MGNFFYKLRQFFQGRYGNDGLNRFLMLLAVICFILSMFRRLIHPLSYVYYAGLVLVVLVILRALSRNRTARARENDIYYRIKYKITSFFKKQKRKVSESGTHRFFTCPHCKTTIRVPKGRGKIEITCPRCRTKFIKKT